MNEIPYEDITPDTPFEITAPEVALICDLIHWSRFRGPELKPDDWKGKAWRAAEDRLLDRVEQAGYRTWLGGPFYNLRSS